MLAKSFILILTSKIILAQISGEFWWLSEKLPYVKHVEAPTIEDDNEFDTDESAKIIFKDNKENINDNAITVGDKKHRKSEKWKIEAHFREDNKIMFSDEYLSHDSNENTNVTERPEKIKDFKKTQASVLPNYEDEFKFYFPDDFLTTNDKKNANSISVSKKKVHSNNKDKYIANNMDISENICNHMEKYECYQQNGIVYKHNYRFDVTSQSNGHLICCVLPLMKEDVSRIIFPGPSYSRQKRSKQNDGRNPALKQREVLLKRRYSSSTDKKVTTPKIVSTDYDDEEYSNTDPYWNIKNTNLKLSSTNNAASTIKSCYQDEDYVVEVPRPGLLGVYSDHSRPGWSINDKDPYGGSAYEDDDNYDDDLPGYSTIDPRKDTTTSKFPKRGKPSKLSTISEENYSPESQTISFQSNPDFQVLQGFKLINLARNKNKYYSNSKKITSESVVEESSEESILIEANSENRNKDTKKIRNCGKVVGNFVSRDGKQLGSSENGSHPWLALVVLTKRRQFILCYATIVHPRAALSTADCIYGRSSGEVMVVAGLRDLKDKLTAQYREASSVVHPHYKPNDLAHNLAILHWSLPLKLTVNVQPACLGELQENSECFIYGWGGYDQAIRSRSRWQRASILNTRTCKARLSSQSKNRQLPSGAFCAEVQAKGTVTGIGGPLMCEMSGQHSATGVAVWRNSVLILLPTLGWPEQALDTLLEAW
ncbi:uncharacterized protein LOC106139422 [Amyelois transitella]|uniref:uncharacterized protein LOC106139422 n=1 Tax=Amyelois transitella TaxID=680683 RepID=UPI00298F4CB7|nr:uncharacterized protein LOC106139422 [Amyelois transitella]